MTTVRAISDVRGPGRPARELNQADVTALYLAGASTKLLAEYYEVGAETVRKNLIEWGVPLRSLGRPPAGSVSTHGLPPMRREAARPEPKRTFCTQCERLVRIDEAAGCGSEWCRAK